MNAKPARATVRQEVTRTLQTLQTWPWLATLRTLRQRFREDRLGLTASSLTFTTTIAIVPLVTVMLAVFSAFPMFAQFQDALQKYFLRSLVPDNIAKPVLPALTQFALQGQACRHPRPGVARVDGARADGDDRPRPQRHLARAPDAFARPPRADLLVGGDAEPLLFGVGLSVTSYAASASSGLFGELPGGVGMLFDILGSCSWGRRWRGCTTSCPTPMCVGAMRWPAACSSPSASNSRSEGWPGTWSRCRPTRSSMARSRRCRSS